MPTPAKCFLRLIELSRMSECLLAAWKNRIDALNESMELRHVLAEKTLSFHVCNNTIFRDQSALKLNVGFDRIHLRRIAECEDAAQVLLAYRRTNFPW